MSLSTKDLSPMSTKESSSFGSELLEAYCVSVPPLKSVSEDTVLNGTQIKEGKTFDVLLDIFKKSEKHCNIPITFKPNQIIKSELQAFFKDPDLGVSERIGRLLGNISTSQNGESLLFIAKVSRNKSEFVFLCRLPVGEAISAKVRKDKLSVKVLDDVFVKNKHSYKIALYEIQKEGIMPNSGYVYDKQTNSPNKNAADYWIKEFLKSTEAMSSVYASKQLAKAIVSTITAIEDIEEKDRLSAVHTVLYAERDQRITPKKALKRYGLKDETIKKIGKKLPSEDFLNQEFKFDFESFREAAPIRIIELDNEILIKGPAKDFEKKVIRKKEDDGEVTVSSKGNIKTHGLAGRK
jgi:hypothetical protein